MKTSNQAPGDMQWIYGIIIWIALGVLAWVLNLLFGLLLLAVPPSPAWQIGLVIVLSIPMGAIGPVLFYRVCSHFVHLAERSDDSAGVDNQKQGDQDVSA